MARHQRPETPDLRLALNGTWDFSPNGRSWSSIAVPACWEAQGYPAGLEGPVVYQRRFTVPDSWRGKRASLRFGAASYLARVWLNGYYLGRHEGLWDAFAFDATAALRLDAENVVRVEVTKPGAHFPWQDTLAGFIPELAMPFGGLWQPVELRAHGELTLGRPYVRASLRGEAVAMVEVAHRGNGSRPAELQAEVLDPSGRPVATAGERLQLEPGRRELRLPFRLSHPQPWEPQTPNRYRLRLALIVDGEMVASAERLFGVRELRARGRQIWLNGRPLMLRGALHWGFYPQHIAPTPSDAEIRAELEQLRALGFNLVKHCLFVPPERYQDIADELGILLWQELPLWPPSVSPAQRRRALRQYPTLVRQRRGHPSLVAYTLGCELNASADAPFLRRLYRAVKRLDPDALVRDNSGSGECYGGLLHDFGDFYDYHFYAEPEHLGPLMDAFVASWRRPRPWLFGEFCDSDTFRDMPVVRERVEPASGWWLSQNLDCNPLAGRRSLPVLEQEQRLEGVALPCDQGALERLSYARSLLVRKQVLERARRDPNLSGYVVTSLRDVPIVTSGLFDDLGQAKWPPEAFEPFNADTVLLLCPQPSRSWSAGGDRLVKGETFCAWAGERVFRLLAVSHFGRGYLRVVLRWRVRSESGDTVAEGETPGLRLAAGEVREAGSFDFQAPRSDHPQRLVMEVWLEGCQQPVRNAWPLLVLPRPNEERMSKAEQAGLVAARLDDAVLKHVRGGGLALVLDAGGGLLPTRPLPFWREGLPLLFEHPVLDGLPHRGYADLAWESLACDRAVETDRLSALLQEAEHLPIVRRLDCRDFRMADYAGELRLGSGRLLYTTLSFERAASPEWGMERCPFAAFLLSRLLGWLELGS